MCRALAAAALLAAAAVAAAVVAGQPDAAAARGGLEAEVATARAAAAAAPDSFEAQLALAGALHRADHAAPNGGKRVPDAAAAYRRAAALAPGGPASPAAAYVLSNLGALLLSGGRVGEAGEVMNATLALAESLGMQRSDVYVGTLFNLAKAEQQRGEQERSQALLLQVVESARGVAGASFLKAWAGLKSFSPEQLAEMEEIQRYLRRARQGPVDEAALSRGERHAWQALQARWGWLGALSPADQSWFNFALWAAYQQAGRHEEAWQALAEGNALQDAAAPFDPAQDTGNVAAIVRMFQPPKPSSADPGDAFYAALMRGEAGFRDPPGLRPIFVVGMPRSGSTLVEQILASHSQVWGAGEDTALAPLLPDLLAVLHAPSGQVEASNIAAVGARYIADMRGRVPSDRPEARWVVDKMLRNMWHIGFIAMMLADPCILHATRHPADAGLSCFAQPFEGRGTPWANNLTHIAQQLELVQRLADHWDAALPGRVMHVRYEDLIRDQEGTTRAMLAHCGIPWEPSVLSFHTTQRTVATASLAQVRQRLYSSSMLRWRRYARQLAPLLRPLRSAILRYEREAGLESSAALLAEVLDTGAAANAGGSAANAAPAAAAGGGPQQEQAQQQAGREEL
ncbi:sulfotransferase [Micractinium conductrix]|uniref:protein-tyrosine sulfotransferase n=1 Tax=Micractinium conductrix TaxID=554055 RepID=A0A2P6V565_9CHLO|nr:sulfotransferase [Micractinium conductrix]|eukprot:PSC69236.1 sulfotransferase [Micractinium conductrix]